MGNFERLSVLVIVVIIVMILVVALYTWTDNSDAPPAKSDSPRVGDAGGSEDGGSPFAGPAAEDSGDAGGEAAGGGLAEGGKHGWEKLFPGENKEPAEPDGGTEADDDPIPTPGNKPIMETPPADPRSMGATPPAEGDAPASDEPWTYTVKSGDTISQIAERELGTWRRQKQIFELNPGIKPESIRAGDQLKMPARGRTSSTSARATGGTSSTAQARGGKITPGTWYVVRRGDRLSRISKRAYGTIDHWPDLWARNLSVVNDPDDIPEGTRIFLPSK